MSSNARAVNAGHLGRVRWLARTPTPTNLSWLIDTEARQDTIPLFCFDRAFGLRALQRERQDPREQVFTCAAICLRGIEVRVRLHASRRTDRPLKSESQRELRNYTALIQL